VWRGKKEVNRMKIWGSGEIMHIGFVFGFVDIMSCSNLKSVPCKSAQDMYFFDLVILQYNKITLI